MNSITLVGRISEPKLTYTNSGTALLTFGLVTNRKVNGEDKASWHNVKAWAQLAENLAAVAVKGSRVIIAGYVEQESYEDKDGNKRTSVTIVANDAGLALRWVNDEKE